MQPHDVWLEETLPRHERLTKAVASILENLLREHQIDFLAVGGRTKDKASALEKIQRKGYKNPAVQFTDLTGLRIVVYLESDLRKVCDLIQGAFAVDKANSLDKDALLSADKIGYRSVHYVCDLGKERLSVAEYKSLAGLKFEIQVRTVLQHAWAELSHDRNYKFAGKLPRDLERKLYLYAGLLEIADRGFDETAAAIDSYVRAMRTRTSHGDYDIEITSLSLSEFVKQWAKRNSFALEDLLKIDDFADLVSELRDFGVTKVSQLNAIASPEYAKAANSIKSSTNIYGLVRDWMLLKDWRRFLDEVSFAWVMDDDEASILQAVMKQEEFEQMAQAFKLRNGGPFDDDFDDSP